MLQSSYYLPKKGAKNGQFFLYPNSNSHRDFYAMDFSHFNLVPPYLLNKLNFLAIFA